MKKFFKINNHIYDFIRWVNSFFNSNQSHISSKIVDKCAKDLRSNKIYRFKGGLPIETGKELTYQLPILNFPELDHYLVPMLQHKGIIGKLIVQVGQYVKAGQPLTKLVLGGDLPVHSPVDGEIVQIIDNYIGSCGNQIPAILIKTSLKQSTDPYYTPLNLNESTPLEIFQRIKDAGIAGLGGAVFPSYQKVSIHSHEYIEHIQGKAEETGSGVKGHTLLINAIECEPYITCDDLLSQNYTADIIEGAQLLMKSLDLHQTVIAFEDNMPQAAESMIEYINSNKITNFYVRILPTIYPQGSSFLLFEALTGIKTSRLLVDYGVYVYNLATIYSIGKAGQGYPLYKRLVTITGKAVQKPGNYWIKFGTPIEEISKYVGAVDYDKIIVGGSMMGVEVKNIKGSTVKSINCLIFSLPTEFAKLPDEENCIRCSLCQNVCPRILQPQLLNWYSKKDNDKELSKLKINDCIECGLCDYVCPSSIPLVSYIKRGKSLLRTLHQKEFQQQVSKQRFEQRNARLEAEAKLAKEKAQQAALERREKSISIDGVDPVQAALARLKAKSQVNTSIVQNGVTDSQLPDNSAIMAERKARRLTKEKAKQAQASIVDDIYSSNSDKIVEAVTEEVSVIDELQVQEDPKKVARDRVIARARSLQMKKVSEISQESQGSEQVVGKELVVDDSQVKENAKQYALARSIAKARQAAKIEKQKQEKDDNKYTANEEIESNYVVNEKLSILIDNKKSAIQRAIEKAKKIQEKNKNV